MKRSLALCALLALEGGLWRVRAPLSPTTRQAAVTKQPGRQPHIRPEWGWGKCGSQKLIRGPWTSISEQPWVGLLLRKFSQGPGPGGQPMPPSLARGHYCRGSHNRTLLSISTLPQRGSNAGARARGMQGWGGVKAWPASVPKRKNPPLHPDPAQPCAIRRVKPLRQAPSSGQPQACVLIPKPPRAG